MKYNIWLEIDILKLIINNILDSNFMLFDSNFWHILIFIWYSVININMYYVFCYPHVRNDFVIDNNFTIWILKLSLGKLWNKQKRSVMK